MSMQIKKVSFGIFSGFMGIQVKIRFVIVVWNFILFYFFYDVIVLLQRMLVLQKRKRGHMSLFLFPSVYHISQLIKSTIVFSQKKKTHRRSIYSNGNFSKITFNEKLFSCLALTNIRSILELNICQDLDPSWLIPLQKRSLMRVLIIAN